MATDTQPAQSVTFPSRVLGIPLVSHGLDTIHSTLSTSPYTKGVYQTGSGLAQSAYDTATRVTVASPVYPRLQPVITAADGYANKGLDTIQSRFPYPFETAPEKVYSDLKKAPEDAKSVAIKTIDERITTPAYGIAKGVDSVSTLFFCSRCRYLISDTDSDHL
jgi:Perilipin family